MKNNLHELYALEELSHNDTFVHKLNPTVKLITSFVFIVTVVSFSRYDLGRLIPYVFYPMLLTALSEIPCSALLKRFLIALPFCLFAGITNMLFDNTVIFSIGGIAVTGGAVSLFTILLRAYLCVMAVLILVSVTPFSDLTGGMRRLKIPSIFILMFEMVYRYIGVLLDEAYSMYIAYSLRSANKRGVEMRDMGSVVGQLLLRSLDRAERVYAAMQCRGYALCGLPTSGGRLTREDYAYLLVICAFCGTLRFLDINVLFVKIFGGLI